MSCLRLCPLVLDSSCVLLLCSEKLLYSFKKKKAGSDNNTNTNNNNDNDDEELKELKNKKKTRQLVQTFEKLKTRVLKNQWSESMELLTEWMSKM